jgi:hypothetical protein
MKKLLLLLVVFFVLGERLLSSGRQQVNLFACLQRRSSRVEPIVEVPQAQEAISVQDELLFLIDEYVGSDTELQSLRRRRREFPCRESSDHNQTCACRKGGDPGFVTMDQVIDKAIVQYPGIMKFRVDLDEQGQDAEEDEQLYGTSKTFPFVLFRMDKICERYVDVIAQEKQIIKKEKRDKRRLQQKMKKLRKSFVQKGVVAVMCRCECRLHKSCFEKMVHEGVERCMRCQENIVSVLEDIGCNFVYPHAGDGFSEEHCPKCIKSLWDFK